MDCDAAAEIEGVRRDQTPDELDPVEEIPRVEKKRRWRSTKYDIGVKRTGAQRSAMGRC
jgi:hypothetical protein